MDATPDQRIKYTYNRKEMLGRALESVICQKTDGLFSYEILSVMRA